MPEIVTLRQQQPRRDPAFYWPRDDERVCVIGATGSGKTWASCWILAHHSIDKRPWLLIDSKQETMFRSLNRMGVIQARLKLSAAAPTQPGLYHVPVREHYDDEALDEFLWRVHARGRTGIFIDEAHSVAPPGRRGSALRAILTQGRAKLIPVIAQSQQPTNIDTYVKSEAQHIILFHLVDRDQRLDMRRYMTADPDADLPNHWAYWYSTKRRFLWRLRPVPDAATILGLIRDRAAPRKTLFGWR